MRIFVGLDIDPAIRQSIAQFAQEMHRLAPGAKWVGAETLHVTLKFIGEQPEDRVEAMKRALAGIQAEPIELEFRGFGFFPSANSARVFWIGVEGGEGLQKLAFQIDEVTASFGIEKEKRYSPHLTLARASERRQTGNAMRSLGGQPQFARVAEALQKRASPDFGAMMAREFFLFQSKLSPKGPDYTKIARFELRNGDSKADSR